MTDGEKKETDEKKVEGSKEGNQFVQNTGRAKSARQQANKEKKDEIEARKADEKGQERSHGKDNTS